MKCEFHGCKKAAEEVIAGDKSRSLKFCPEHVEQGRAAWGSGDPKKVLGFWMKARGGAERASKIITEDPAFQRGVRGIMALGKIAEDNQRKKARSK